MIAYITKSIKVIKESFFIFIWDTKNPFKLI